ncbi:hypothetical protein HNQ93_002667 [Hymenobacter luteus]|uniref:Uracil-DNA glycosylase-like domain-containing protein n=2 Tax=Hymenobacter TaxID=89966 RepID=A0A7W9T1C7_9BACT|nr:MULTISPECIES: uracil-DNA glycosylase family protein [Hymenobacter]MBB4601764.1 hypothetical protein [Hymenobacter latericoloratus]MBB6059807.1 hypothetical protein [Hymenobacter luteus]
MPFADRLLRFLSEFPLPPPLPESVQAFSPYQDPTPLGLFTQFARQYYTGNQPRVAVLGINPGRLGNGRTGVAFTDPVALAAWGIENELPRRREPSSEFMQAVVTAMGGPAAFYGQFYLGSLYPLVLLRNGLNYNFYDSPVVTAALWPTMQQGMRQLVEEVGLARHAAICLGRRNGQYFTRLNEELGLFEQLHILDHPRYLMQYKRRHLADNVAHYVETLRSAGNVGNMHQG